ncbi:MAG: hypothetical protein H8E45_01005 [Proteobacteria bacterium]|nr:hypothetical protein [Pseudomonadota bacterium]
MERFEGILMVGAALSFGLALLHVAMIPFGARAYRYFTAGDWMIEQSESGSPLPGLLTLGIAAILASFGLYALAAAGVPISLPFIRAGVTVVAAIYLLRGLGCFPQLVMLSRGSQKVAPREPVFSAVSLAIGIVYAAGIALGWSALG